MDPQINLDGSVFHKPCAKCQDCQCQITISNFCKNESGEDVVLLCKTHYFKRFHEGGAYIGGDKFQHKAARDVTAGSGERVISDTIISESNSVGESLPIGKISLEYQSKVAKEVEKPSSVTAAVKNASWPPKAESANTEQDAPVRETRVKKGGNKDKQDYSTKKKLSDSIPELQETVVEKTENGEAGDEKLLDSEF
jgi:hypothetical protein